MIRYVLKADGSFVPFSKEKIIGTCARTGVSAKTANDIADWVETNIPDKSSTRDVYESVLRKIEETSPLSGALFRLRDAIADLDSQSFEIYALKILKSQGWKVEWNRLIKGASVEHQVDIVAAKGDETWLVECKRHFNPHRWTGLDVTLQVQARLEDIRDGYSKGISAYDFTGAWIFTNSKFSEHAIQYAAAKDMRLTGWRTGSPSIEKLAETAKVFPITLLNIETSSKAKLLDANIVTLQDVAATKRGPVQNWQSVTQMAKSLTGQ